MYTIFVPSFTKAPNFGTMLQTCKPVSCRLLLPKYGREWHRQLHPLQQVKVLSTVFRNGYSQE